MIVSFPHNPTTVIATPELMQRLVDLAREREFVLVHDFAYADIAFDGHGPPSVLAADGALDCAVELYSLTKSFSMAGWRMGFTLGRPDVVAALAKLKSYLDYGTFQPIQIASIVALREAPDYPLEVCEIYLRRRDALISGLARAGWEVEPPKGTMFVWAPIPEQMRELGSLECAIALARGADVAVSPGIGFGPGGDGHVRFALVENEQRIGQATRSIRKLLAPPSRAHQVTAPSEAERDGGRVLGEHALRVAGRGRRPRGEPLLQLLGGEIEVEPPVRDVEHDRVAVADGRDRPAAGGLGRDMADHQAVGGAREAAVGDQRHLVSEPLADERRGDVQHLAHTWAAGRALVPDHDHLAGNDRPRLDGGEAVLLRVEDPGGPAMVEPLVAGELHDGALGRERAAQDRQAAGRLERRLPRDDDVLPRALLDLDRPPARACARRPRAHPRG